MIKALVFFAALIVVSYFLLQASFKTGQTPDTSTLSLQTTCIDGVVYFYSKETVPYKGYGFMAPKYNQDGSIQNCQ